MAFTGPGGRTNVIIKIDVDGVPAAQAQLSSLLGTLKGLDGASGDVSSSMTKAGRELDRVSDRTKKQKNHWKELEKQLDKVGGRFKSLLGAFSGLLKPLLILGAEFGVMVATMGAFKLALVTGDLVVRGFRASLTALGAAAGVAVGAIAGVLGAMRQLKAAQMAPKFYDKETGTIQRGATGAQGRMSQLYSDPRLAFFGEEALSGAMSAQLQAGGKADGAFRAQLARYGDFAMGDPKALTGIAQAMAQAQKAGKVTADTYQEFQKVAPGLAAAFEEMAGGADAAKTAEIEFSKFNEAVNAGTLESLKPYNGALNEINNTVIGKLKSSLASLKEQITSVGLGSFGELYGPKSPFGATTGKGQNTSIVQAMGNVIDDVRRSLTLTLTSIAPTIQKVMPGVLSRLSSPLEKMSEFLTRTIVRGMERLDDFQMNLSSWAGAVRNFFTSVGDYMRPFAESWDSLWSSLLQPIFSSLGGLINYFMQSWNTVTSNTQNSLASWGTNLSQIIDGLRTVVDAIVIFKEAFAPVFATVLRIVNLFGKFFALPVVGMLASWGIAFFMFKAAIQKLGMVLLKLGIRFMAFGREQDMARTKIRGTISAIRSETAAIDQQTAALQRNAMARRQAGMGGGMPAGGGALPGRNAPLGPLGPNPYPAGGAAGAAGRTGMMGRMRGGFKGAPGMGATVAGLGLSVVGGMISEAGRPTDQASQGLGGAVSGLGTGAAIGSMILPGWGTAIGGGIGLIAGGVGGVMNARDALKKQQRDQAKRIKEQIQGDGPKTLRDLDKAREKAAKYEKLINDKRKNEALGGIAAEQARMRLNQQLDKAKIDSLTGAENGINEVQKGFKKQERALRDNKKLAELMGMSARELGEWAQKNGKDVAEAMLTWADLQKITGFTGTPGENRALASRRIGEGLLSTANTKAAESQAAIDAVNARVAFYEAGRTPLGVDQATVEANKLMTAAVGRVQAAYSAGTYGKGPGAFATFQQNVNAGLDSEVALAQQRGVGGNALQALIDQAALTRWNLAEMSGTFGGRQQVDQSFIPGLRDTAREAIRETLGANGTPADARKAARTAVEESLKAQGITIKPEDKATLDKLIAKQVKSNSDAPTRIQAAMETGGRLAAIAIQQGFPKEIKVTGFNPTTGALTISGARTVETLPPRGKEGDVVMFQNHPYRYSADRGWEKIGDTTTSRFARTMARHNALNSMVAGRRSITSGLRNFNLGSGSSDHLNGHAYDLTGDNLGAYAGLVKSTGGFAEFHGAASSRHLHVVPGTGDTATPVVARVPVMAGGGGSQVNNYNVTVNAAPGMSPEAIANAVMAKIATKQRDSMERR